LLQSTVDAGSDATLQVAVTCKKANVEIFLWARHVASSLGVCVTTYAVCVNCELFVRLFVCATDKQKVTKM